MNAIVDISQIRLETDRLNLRPWEQGDLEDFYEYARVDGVGQMAGWLPHDSIEATQKVLDSFISKKKTFALEWKENGKVIGSLGLEKEEPVLELPKDRVGRSIGYVLSKDYWGRGVMAEALRAVIDYCFREEHYDFLTCGHFLSNYRSRRVMEKCGFVPVAETLHQTRWGSWEPTRLYLLRNFRKVTAPWDVTGIRIESPRLLLRPLAMEDLEAFHEIVSDPDVASMEGGCPCADLAMTRQRLENSVSRKEDLAIIRKDTGAMIGIIAAQARDWKRYPMDPWMVGREFGFGLNKAHWGNGFAPEAVTAVTRYCFDTLRYDFVSCGHFPRNQRSARVIEKCGFHFLFEGEFDFDPNVTERIRTYIRYNPKMEK